MGLKDKNILITGATGFVGYNLAKALVKTNKVYCLVRASSNVDKLKKLGGVSFIFYDGGLQSLTVPLSQMTIDITFHLAACSIAEHTADKVDTLIQSNILFPTQLLEALIASSSKFVNTGTFWQNYTHATYDPTCLYAATKESFEALLKYYNVVKGLQCVTLQLYDTYGPEDERKKLFWLLDELRDTGKTLDMSPGKQKLNLVYIDDIVAAYILAAQMLLSHHISDKVNYGVYTNHEYSLQEIVRLYEQQNRCTLNINWGKKKYRTREVMTPNYLYPILPDWKPSVELTEGLKKLST